MASYVPPRVRIFQEFNQIPATVADPLRALVIGPHGIPHRYANADEKETILLGGYSPSQEVTYSWPGKRVGSRIDPTFTKLYADDAFLRYYSDGLSSGPTVAPVSGYRNRIRANTLVFKTGNGYDRSASFYDRDVTIGDAVTVRGTYGGEEYSLIAAVRNFVPEVIPSVVAAAVEEVANADAQTLATSIDKVGGAENGIVLTAHAGQYDGLADGDIDETYLIEVIQSSVGGDLTSARLRVTSSSGRDNDASVIPAGVGGNTAIGSRHLFVEFDVNASVSASSEALDDDVSVKDLVAGQKWKVRVTQAFTVPVATSSGTYSGTQTTTYIVLVTKGGLWDDEPEVSVYSTTAYDSAGPVVVTGPATPVAVGSYQVLIAFSGNGLRKNDKYYITATAPTSGAIRTLALTRDLPENLLLATDLSLDLFIRKNIEVPTARVGFSPLTNWTADQSGITVSDGMIAYDPTWTDGGEELPLDVSDADLYVQYREWSTEYVNDLGEASLTGDVVDLLGTADHDNPLGFGVLKALENSNGTLVRFAAVTDPDDLDSWLETLNTVGDSTDSIYNVVPMTYDRRVGSAVAGHVTGLSAPDVGRWRGCFLATETPLSREVVGPTSSANASVVLATLFDDPNESGTQYTLLSITSGNADLDSLGVRPGDVVRFLYSTDGFGGVTYDSFVVSEVLSGESLVLATGHDAAVSVAQRVEIHRNLNQREQADEIGAVAASYGNRRVCSVWAENPTVGGEVVENYYVAAALAGYRSGVAPHQPLTNLQILGFDSVRRSFSSTNLNRMAEKGTWIVVRNTDDEIVTRHALTTDMSSLEFQTESIRSNVDSISYILLDQLRGFIGRSNITPETVEVVRTTVIAALEFLKSRTYTDTSGAQVISYTITKIVQSDIQADKIDVYITLQLPIPLNYIDVLLQI